MPTETSKPDSITPSSEQDSSQKNSTVNSSPKDDKESIKALLTEARQTKEVLEQFESAIHAGQFPGHAMMPLAKGLAFVSAVTAQTKAHIFNLQTRLEKNISPEGGNA